MWLGGGGAPGPCASHPRPPSKAPPPRQPFPDVVFLYPSVKWDRHGFPTGFLSRLCLWKRVRSGSPLSAVWTLV